MNLVAMSAQAYRQAPEKALALAGQLLGDNRLSEVIVDWPAVSRLGEMPAYCLDNVHVIGLHRWVRENTDGYEPDERVMGSDASTLSADRPLLLDASGFDLPSIIGVMDMARNVWFSLERWHPQFVLVVDDSILLPAAEVLFDTFHFRPRALPVRQLKRIGKAFLRRALLSRWFGLNASKVRRFAERLMSVYERLSQQSPEKGRKELAKWGI